MREPPHSLADFGSFSRFRLQEKHNASLFQYVFVPKNAANIIKIYEIIIKNVGKK